MELHNYDTALDHLHRVLDVDPECVLSGLSPPPPIPTIGL
jgi:hypothetical protein